MERSAIIKVISMGEGRDVSGRATFWQDTVAYINPGHRGERGETRAILWRCEVTVMGQRLVERSSGLLEEAVGLMVGLNLPILGVLSGMCWVWGEFGQLHRPVCPGGTGLVWDGGGGGGVEVEGRRGIIWAVVKNIEVQVVLQYPGSKY